MGQWHSLEFREVGKGGVKDDSLWLGGLQLVLVQVHMPPLVLETSNSLPLIQAGAECGCSPSWLLIFTGALLYRQVSRWKKEKWAECLVTSTKPKWTRQKAQHCCPGRPSLPIRTFFPNTWLIMLTLTGRRGPRNTGNLARNCQCDARDGSCIRRLFRTRTRWCKKSAMFGRLRSLFPTPILWLLSLSITPDFRHLPSLFSSPDHYPFF